MVFCLKHFIPLLILPYPTAAPLFVGLYLVSVFLSVKPCVYCTALLSVLFTSTCYTHLSNLPPSFSSPPPSSVSDPQHLPSNASSAIPSLVSLLTPPSTLQNFTQLPTSNLSLTTPDPIRCWCDLNHLRLFDPVLVGYRRRDEIFKAEDEREKLGADAEEASHREMELKEAKQRQKDADEEAKLPKSWSRQIGGLFVHPWVNSSYSWARSKMVNNSSSSTSSSKTVAPPPPPPAARWDAEKSRLDLRTRGGEGAGVGWILDFGWGRGESVVKEDMERARIRRRGGIVAAKKE